jgi:hypothetical protein
MSHVTGPELPPTSTPVERLTLGLACLAALVFLALGWWWPFAAAIAAIVVNLVVQQVRENGERREGQEQLERYLLSASESEQQDALRAHQRRFPSAAVARRLAPREPRPRLTGVGVVEALAAVAGVALVVAAIGNAGDASFMLGAAGVLILLGLVALVRSR